jgi:hypothetical protein
MADDFAKEVRELYTEAEEADRRNTEEALIDLDFEGFNQWDERIRNWRESQEQPLPCFTINTAQQYTALIVGDWLSNETAIRALPREDGTTEIAEVRSELIRSIELHSNADRIYASCLGQAAGCGISNFRIDIDDAYEDAFVRDIFIRDIPNPLAVKWDPLAFDPTGKDATYCFVGDKITTAEYKRRYPKAALPTLINKELGSTWSDGKTVTLPEYWKIVTKTRTIGMTADGKTVDLTDMPKSKWPKLAVDSDTNQKIINDKAKCNYAVRVMTNGMEALDAPYELKLPRLPIIRVTGREVWTKDGRVRFGLVRCLRDSQRFKNYLRSLRAELLVRAPRANFIAEASAIEGVQSDWDNTLVYATGAQKPEQVTADNLVALLNEERIYSQDMMDVTGIHEASKGMPSNEQSGVAIRARQQEGDIATQIYHQNMTAAQQEAGEVINALIPVVYDTPRTLRTVGPDLGVKMVRVNDPNPNLLPNGKINPKPYINDQHPTGETNPAYKKESDKYANVGAAIPDLGIGRYGVVISTGPQYQTRRQEAVDAMMQLIQAQPSLAQIIGDLVVKEMDIPNADQIAERIKRVMPPQVLGDDAEDGKSPEEIAQAKQQAEQAQQMQQTGVMLEMRGKQADTDLKESQAEEARAKAALAKIEVVKALGGEAPDPSIAAEEQRTAIMGYDAITKRLQVLSNQKNAPSALESQLAPIIANAVGQALAHHLGFAPVQLGLPDTPTEQPANTKTPGMGAAA